MSYTNGLDDPTLYFNTKLYTGNGSTQSITGVGFQPDFLWFKNRDVAQWFQIYDVIRGIGSTSYYLSSNTSNAEASTTNSLTGVSSDGFSLGNNIGVNGSANNIVAWNWKAGGTTASNTDGSITSTVSANTTSGFSIVSYTGTGSNATVGHGLGAVPKMIIVKLRSSAGDWTVYNSVIGNTNFLRLNGTLASTSQATYWNNTSPTSSVFTVGSAGDVNTSSGTHIAYCFAEKKGFSKFGKFEGNNNADGSFVYLGFKPAFIMTKSSGTGGTGYDWVMFDNKRNTFNVSDNTLDANLSNAEVTSGRNEVDFLSNGFKCRSSYGDLNSNTTYIYMAFAESPFTTSTGIPTVAR